MKDLPRVTQLDCSTSSRNTEGFLRAPPNLPPILAPPSFFTQTQSAVCTPLFPGAPVPLFTLTHHLPNGETLGLWLPRGWGSQRPPRS